MADKRAYKSGTVYQRKSDGRWIGSLPDGHGGRARYVTGTDKAAVEKRLAALATSMTSPRKPRAEMVAAFLARWLDGEEKRGRLRPRTASGYRTLIELHIAPAIGRIRIDELDASDVDGMVGKVMAHRSPQTARHAHKVLRRALGQAVKWDLIPRNVATLVDAPTVPRPRVHPLTADEARRFLAATADDPRHALYALALTTGMRRGELLALKWPDIDLKAGTVRVEHSLRQLSRWRFVRDDPKTDKSRRTLTIPGPALAALRAHKAAATTTGYVFARPDGRPLPPAEVTRDFQVTLIAHGFRKVRFHDLRHTAANLMLDALGGDVVAVSKTLGHATIATTVDLYGTAADDARRRAAAAMERALEAPTRQKNGRRRP